MNKNTFMYRWLIKNNSVVEYQKDINGWNKSTFSQKKEIIRALLHGQEVGVDFDELFLFMIESFFNQYHSKKYNLLISRAYVDKIDAPYSMKQQTNIYFDGLSDGVTVIKQMCSLGHTYANPQPHRNDEILNFSKDFNGALRFAVSESMNEVKNKMLLTHKNCSICGTSLVGMDRSKIHLDHCGDFEFRHIKEMFIDAIHKDSTDINLELYDHVTGHGHSLKDEYTKNVWTEFHNHLAEYQLTCLKCNLGKAKK